MREIKLLRASSHDNIVSVIEAFRSQSSGNVYLVMEYAERYGGSGAARSRRLHAGRRNTVTQHCNHLHTRCP